MDKEKKAGRPKNEEETTQKLIRIPNDLLAKSEAKGKTLGLKFPEYVRYLLTKAIG